MTKNNLTLASLEQQTSQLLTLGELLVWTEQLFIQEDLFYGHGTLEAWDEAVWIILYTLGLPLETDRSCLSRILTDSEKNNCLKLILRRINENKPAAYLLQSCPFAGLDFYVDERVLIPRSPIAELIENAFQPWINTENVKSILDLATGSGCIAIACAKYFPDAKVDASDISPDALAVAKINVDKHQLQQQVSLIQSDLYSNLQNKCYDIIVSNPPYLDAIDMTDLPAEYHHEPMHALEAGEDGLRFVIPILQNALTHLNPGGIVIVEVGNSEEALYDKFPDVPFYSLEFERGTDGVILLTYDQLLEYQQYL